MHHSDMDCSAITNFSYKSRFVASVSTDTLSETMDRALTLRAISKRLQEDARELRLGARRARRCSTSRMRDTVECLLECIESEIGLVDAGMDVESGRIGI